MSLGRVLFDSAVFIYAVGSDHEYRAPCRTLVAALSDVSVITGEASVLAAQELMHQRARRTGDRATAATAAKAIATFCTLHEFTVDDLHLATDLFRRAQGLDAADACHAATALNRGITTIVSPDGAFDSVPGLTRLDPADAATTL